MKCILINEKKKKKFVIIFQPLFLSLQKFPQGKFFFKLKDLGKNLFFFLNMKIFEYSTI